MTATVALNALNDALASVENCEAKLAIARRNAAPKSVIVDLQTRLIALGNRMNQLWDEWNDAMQADRLARIYK